MKAYQFDISVQIFDTDCFGVMWHGAYTKWLEMGRVDFLKSVGIELSKPGKEDGYIYPVVEQNLRFRAPARMGDRLTITTSVEMEGYKLVFSQTCWDHDSEKTTLEAKTTVVILDSQWRTHRKIPHHLAEKLSKKITQVS
jgi:acyl-CoA thioester hydrolase